MAEIYFVRHGETVWNVENKICGMTDIELTDKGHVQACETGKKILENGYHIDEIIYSPLVRAKDTALHIAEVTGIPARPEKRLYEQNFGRFESTPRNGEEFARAKRECAYRYDGGESMFQMAQRIYNLLDELKEESERTGKVFMMVAHNGIARVVNSYFYEMSNEEYANFGIRNCDIVRYEFKK